MEGSTLRAAVCAALCAWVGACGGGDATSLTVELYTDFVPGVEFDSVRTTFTPVEPPDARTAVRPAELRMSYVRGRRVAEFDDAPHGEATVRVELVRASSVIAARTVRVRIDRSYAVPVLITRSCLNVVCPGAGDPTGATECVGGRCVDPRCGGIDPSLCNPPDCTVDAQCTSAIACVAGQCFGGVCVFGGDDERCGDGAYCDPDVGCQPLPGVDGGVDAGTDAGELDAGPIPPRRVSAVTSGGGVATRAADDASGWMCIGQPLVTPELGARAAFGLGAAFQAR